MKKILTAVALSIALPAAAFAQAEATPTPTPAGNMSCCDQKAMAECQNGMAPMSSHMSHDMNMGQMKMDHDMKQPTAPRPVQPRKQ